MLKKCKEKGGENTKKCHRKNSVTQYVDAKFFLKILEITRVLKRVLIEYYSMKILLFFEVVYAVLANKFTFVVDNVVGVTAKDTSGLIFLQDDFVVVGENFNRIVNTQMHNVSKLDRYNKTSE